MTVATVREVVASGLRNAADCLDPPVHAAQDDASEAQPAARDPYRSEPADDGPTLTTCAGCGRENAALQTLHKMGALWTMDAKPLTDCVCKP